MKKLLTPLVLLFILFPLAVQAREQAGPYQPTGGVSGPIAQAQQLPRVVVSPGHGYYFHETWGWKTERGDCVGQCVVEDFNNVDMTLPIYNKLVESGFEVFSTRELNKNTGNHPVSGKPWWQMNASEYLRYQANVPDSVWDPKPDIYTSVLSRDWASRPYYANWLGADVLINIHSNAGGGHGTLVIYEPTNMYASQSKVLAEAINRKIKEQLQQNGYPNWPSQVRAKSLTENISFTGPAVLIEMGFHDNPIDNAAIQNPNFREAAALAIRDAIAEYAGTSMPLVPACVSPGTTYCDVPANHSFYSFIQALTDKGVVNGYPPDAYGQRFFKPDDPLGRDAAAKYIANTLRAGWGIDRCDYSGLNFPDIAENQPFYNDILCLKNLGIVNGYSDGEYKPTQPVTREAMAKYITQMLRVLWGTDRCNYAGANFGDVPASNLFFNDILCLKNAGIVNGYSNGDYKPGDVVTRGAAAKFVELARQQAPYHRSNSGPPAAPSDLRIIEATSNTVTLQWADNAHNESGFTVYRWSDNGPDVGWMELGSAGANVTRFNDYGVKCGTTYYYIVGAFNQAGTSGQSPLAEAATKPCDYQTTPSASNPVPPSLEPAAILAGSTPVGSCGHDVVMQLSGFAPNSTVTITSDYSEVSCDTGNRVASSWTQDYHLPTGAEGNLTVAYRHNGTGSYHYTFTDRAGHQASLRFTLP